MSSRSFSRFGIADSAMTERVLRVARGMVGREVERFEVVEVGLDLRAEVGAVAEVVEDAGRSRAWS